MKGLSIIIPCRGVPQYRIAALLESLRSELMGIHDFEIIVVENGSKLLRDVNLERVSFHSLKRPNTAGARNYGVSRSLFETILFIDSHVRFPSGALVQLLDIKERNSAVAQTCSVQLENGPKSLYVKLQRASWEVSYEGFNSLLPKSHVCFPTVDTAFLIIDKSSFLEVGGFNETFRRCEDFELSTRLFDHGLRVAGTQKIKVSKNSSHKTALDFISEQTLGQFYRAMFFMSNDLHAPYSVRTIFWEDINLFQSSLSQARSFKGIISLLVWVVILTVKGIFSIILFIFFLPKSAKLLRRHLVYRTQDIRYFWKVDDWYYCQRPLSDIKTIRGMKGAACYVFLTFPKLTQDSGIKTFLGLINMCSLDKKSHDNILKNLESWVPK